MSEKRYHATKLDDKQQLFYGSLLEIAEVLGHSLHAPVSVSLLCLTFGITNDEKGKLFVAFSRVLQENEFEQLSVPLFRKAIEDTIPVEDIMPGKTMPDISVIAFIKAFARNLMANLEPFARSL